MSPSCWPEPSLRRQFEPRNSHFAWSKLWGCLKHADPSHYPWYKDGEHVKATLLLWHLYAIDGVGDVENSGIATCVGVDDVLSEETNHPKGSQPRALSLKQNYCLPCVFDTEAGVHYGLEALFSRPIWTVRGLKTEAKTRDPVDENPVSRAIIAGRREHEAVVIRHQDPGRRRHSRDVIHLKSVQPALLKGRRVCRSSVGQLLSCSRDVLDEIVPEAQVVGGIGFHDGAQETDGP